MAHDPVAIVTGGASGIGRAITARLRQNADVIRNIPAGHVTQPEEIAEAVGLLCPDRLPSVTGMVFVIDGGWTSSLGMASADAALDGAAAR